MVNDPILAFGVGILFGAILCKVLIESARDPHSPPTSQPLYQSFPPQSILINNYVGKQSFEESMQSFDDDGWDDFDDDKDDPTELEGVGSGMDDDDRDDDDGEEWKKRGTPEPEDSFDEEDWRKTGDH